MANIRDVAKLAGVSVATVSRVLNRKGYIHEDTIKQVEAAAATLQYKPNAVAKVPFKKNAAMLAVLLPGFEYPSFHHLLSTIEQTSYELGYQVMICNVKERDSYLDVLQQHNIAGVLTTKSVYTHMKEKGITLPAVMLDGEECANGDYEGAILAMRHLLKKGSRFFAFIKGPNTPIMDERYEGFLDVVEEKRLSYRVIESELSVAAGEKAALKLLQNCPYVDSIFACNDAVAIGALRAAHRLGIIVPNELQVIGFGGSREGEFVYPSLTTIAGIAEETGELATKELIRQVQGKKVDTYVRRTISNLIERESTKAHCPVLF